MRRPSHLRIAALVSSSVFLIGGLATPAFAQSPTITGFSPPSGAAGASVTIIGTAFTAVSDVQFNGTSAPFSVDSHTQITSSLPPGATTEPTSVDTPRG